MESFNMGEHDHIYRINLGNHLTITRIDPTSIHHGSVVGLISDGGSHIEIVDLRLIMGVNLPDVIGKTHEIPSWEDLVCAAYSDYQFSLSPDGMVCYYPSDGTDRNNLHRICPVIGL
jgi:hypothetical protein